MRRVLLLVEIMIIVIIVSGCYSFKGGSVPPHLTTLNILTVKDNSGALNPDNRLRFTEYLIDEFNDDGSLRVVKSNADARLETTLRATREESAEIGEQELESRRKVVIVCNVVYYDNVKQKEIFNQDFENYGFFEVAQAQTQRDEAIREAMRKISEDIVFQVVSGW